MSTAWEQLEGAALSLARSGPIKERLADAFLENAYATDRKLLLARNQVALAGGEKDLRVVELYSAVRPASSKTFDAGSYLYFEREKLLSMYEAGVKNIVGHCATPRMQQQALHMG